MKILAVDTATQSCSVAVTDGDELLAEMTIVRKQTHSRHLMKMIDTVTDAAGVTVPELDALAVTRGPGSFTGLRIGISTVKGLALAARKPLVGISALAVLASGLWLARHPICAVLDARKGEVYAAWYRFEDGVPKAESEERVASPEEAVSGTDGPCILVGNGALLYRERISAHLGASARFAPAGAHLLRASAVARLAAERLKRGETDSLAAFSPQYIRKSDAELNFGKNAEPARFTGTGLMHLKI